MNNDRKRKARSRAAERAKKQGRFLDSLLPNTAARPVVTSSSFDPNLRSWSSTGWPMRRRLVKDEEIYDKDGAGSILLIRKRGTELGTDALLTKVSLE